MCGTYMLCKLKRCSSSKSGHVEFLCWYSRSFQNSAQLIMVPFFPVSNNEALAPMEGNPFRDVWKAACWKMSQEVCIFVFLLSTWHCQNSKMKTSIFLSFYFHEVLEQLKLRFFKFSLWKGSLFFDRLCLNALHLRGGRDSCHVD